MDDLIFTTKNMLLHHGIQGQKWGIRNGPPYPLDSSKSTGKKLKNTVGYGAWTAARYTRNGDVPGYVVAYDYQDYKDGNYDPNGYFSDIDKYLNSKIPENYTFGLTAGNTLDSASQNPVSITKDGLKNTAELLDESYWPKTNKVDNFDDAFSRMDVNPKYGTADDTIGQYSNNCGYCSVAETLRFMGYEDITARPGINGLNILDQRNMFDDYKQIQDNVAGDSRSQIDRKFDSLPNNSFGTIGGFGDDYGHIFNFYKDNNQTVFIDPQTSNVYNSLDDFENACTGWKPNNYVAYDMTNAKPNLKEIGKFGAIQDDRLLSGNREYDVIENRGQSYVSDVWNDQLMDDWKPRY